VCNTTKEKRQIKNVP